MRVGVTETPTHKAGTFNLLLNKTLGYRARVHRDGGEKESDGVLARKGKETEKKITDTLKKQDEAEERRSTPNVAQETARRSPICLISRVSLNEIHENIPTNAEDG